MSRWVVPKTVQVNAAREKPDGPLGRLAKYIPGEVVTAFTMFVTLFAALKLDASRNLLAACVLLVAFEAATVAYIANSTSGAVRRAHLIVGPVAFLAWGYQIASSLLGGWFVPFVSLIGQAIVVALAIAIAPRE